MSRHLNPMPFGQLHLQRVRRKMFHRDAIPSHHFVQVDMVNGG